MREIKLEFPSGYDQKTQAIVGLFAAQFDDMLRRLKKVVEELEVRHLEWQPAPGMNTVGMLLAHLALTEVWWINIAAREIPSRPDGQKILDELFGIPNFDDGLPLTAEGNHPEVLTGLTLSDYLRYLDIARQKVHSELRGWEDSQLHDSFKLREEKVSREWTLYHVLEHFASHYGQVQLLKHLMRNAGVLEKK
ncbi:MAG: DinB family protein [bacterium]|jgi:hypothetical protein